MGVNIKKIIYAILIMLVFLLLLFIVFIVLLFCGKIEEYTYLKINNKNEEQVTTLLQEQEKYMINLEIIKELNECYKNMRKIEVVYKFPDGEDYVIYCQEDKVNFSLDNSNYNLPKYFSENGHIGFRFK